MKYKYSYEPEADVLAITISNKKYDHAIEMGDFIVHVDENDKAVYIEVLNARQFLKNASATIPSSIRKTILTA